MGDLRALGPAAAGLIFIYAFIDKNLLPRYNQCMRKFNFFTWMISYDGKPLSYRLWVMIVFPLLFIMWLCAQFVFTDLVGWYFLCFALPFAAVGLTWDAAIYFYYRRIGAFDENGCLKEGYPRKISLKKKKHSA